MNDFNNLPEWYTPVNWEAYCKFLDYKIKQAQFWLNPTMLPIAMALILIAALLNQEDK